MIFLLYLIYCVATGTMPTLVALLSLIIGDLLIYVATKG